jgi:excisionase family DNA binding protein
MRTELQLPLLIASTPPESAATVAKSSQASAKVKIRHLSTEDAFAAVGMSVGSVRRCLTECFSISTHAGAKVCGQGVGPDHVLAAGDELIFMVEEGHKEVGAHVWTKEELCEFFQITPEELDIWIAQGLKVTPHPVRITETAVDEFNRGKEVETPYLTAEEAASYLRTTVKGIYSLLERRKLRKLPGSRTILFTRAILDAYVQGGE